MLNYLNDPALAPQPVILDPPVPCGDFSPLPPLVGEVYGWAKRFAIEAERRGLRLTFRDAVANLSATLGLKPEAFPDDYGWALRQCFIEA